MRFFVVVAVDLMMVVDFDLSAAGSSYDFEASWNMPDYCIMTEFVICCLIR
jgi:hypothetical protein